MKKILKSCLLIFFILGILVVGAVTVMFFAEVCPPQGPWPMPPWCGEGDSLPIPAVSLPDLPDLVTINPTEQPMPAIYQLPAEYQGKMTGEGWQSDPHLPADFMLGHTFMDVYASILFQDSLTQTIQAMHNTGATWVVYDNYWSYESLDPPLISSFPDTQGFRNASGEEICQMVEETHQLNMKFALMLELNFDLAAGDFQDWDHARDFWVTSQQLLEEKSQDIPGNQDYWDSWFESYDLFVSDQAVIARDCGVDLFVIGKQIDGAIKKETEGSWREIIAAVREIYSGPISYAAFTNEYYSQAVDFPIDALDYLMIYLYNNISDLESPSLDELITSFENFHDLQFEPLSQKSGIPVIFLTPFQSRDYGARQEWFEPAAPAPEVEEDLLIQAQLYEALFQSIQDEDWVAGIFTWGFWWRDDFNRLWEEGDSSFNKSSSVRNKPADWVIQKWAEGIDSNY